MLVNFLENFHQHVAPITEERKTILKKVTGLSIRPGTCRSSGRYSDHQSTAKTSAAPYKGEVFSASYILLLYCGWGTMATTF